MLKASKVAKLWLALGSRRSGHSAAYLCMHNREGSLSLVRTRGGSPKAILHASERVERRHFYHMLLRPLSASPRGPERPCKVMATPGSRREGSSVLD